MKYTKEQMQVMSDFEVNATLAELLGLNVLHDVDPLHSETAAVYHNGCNAEEYNGTNIDYCNTPNDIMPLAFEHGVDYKKLPSTGKFAADYAYDITTHFIDANPLRAIACCLILVLQGEKNDRTKHSK